MENNAMEIIVGTESFKIEGNATVNNSVLVVMGKSSSEFNALCRYLENEDKQQSLKLLSIVSVNNEMSLIDCYDYCHPTPTEINSTTSQIKVSFNSLVEGFKINDLLFKKIEVSIVVSNSFWMPNHNIVASDDINISLQNENDVMKIILMSEKLKYEMFEEIWTAIFKLAYILGGEPKVNQIVVYSVDDLKCGTYHGKYDDLYTYIYKSPISKINSSLVNKQSFDFFDLKFFLDLYERNRLRFSTFFAAIGANTYKDVTLAWLVQCLEGFYDLVCKEKLGKLFEDKENLCMFCLKNSFKVKLKTLFDLFGDLVLPKEFSNEGRKKKIIDSCYNLRNQISHCKNADEEPVKISGIEFCYISEKVVLMIRLLIIKVIGLNYDDEAVKNLVKTIDVFYLGKK